MLLEFLKFRVLASQEVFFQAWLPGDAPRLPQPTAQALAELDLAAFRRWLQANAAFQPKCVSMNCRSHPHAAATINTGGAA